MFNGIIYHQGKVKKISSSKKGKSIFIYSKISINKKNLDYIILRIERSYEKALEIAKKIDRQSLESHAKINYKFLKKLID